MPDALVSNNYGMTEAGTAYCIMPQGEAVKRPGSVGQIAPPAVVKIVASSPLNVMFDAAMTAVFEPKLQLLFGGNEMIEGAAATAAV